MRNSPLRPEAGLPGMVELKLLVAADPFRAFQCGL